MILALAHSFQPSTTAIAGSAIGTALVSLLPLVFFFVALGVFSLPTHWCALGALVVALIVATVGFDMPVATAGMSAIEGAAFGLIPIIYIVVMAVWLYNLTDRSGRAADVQAVFSAVGKGDMRIQGLLIGYAFCGLLEGLAGFGAPVAIACTMMWALGLPPIRAAIAVMVGNALNVGFGAMAIPVTTVAKLGGEDPALVGATMGRITPLMLIIVPFLMLFIMDGWRGVKDGWLAGVVAWFGMALGIGLTSNVLSYELTAVVGSLLSFAALAALLRFWTPTTPSEFRSPAATETLSTSRVALGLLPYWLVVIVFGVAKLWKLGVNVPALLASTDIKFVWPGLGDVLGINGQQNPSAVFSVPWLSSPGTMLFLTGVVVAIVYARNSSAGRFELPFAQGIRTLGTTIYNLRIAILTICLVMALAYVMNFSGQTVAIGAWLAGTGAAFAFLSPLLGWIGTAVTGSATSAGALFGNLQATAAQTADLPSRLLLGVNEIGGGIGKIVSPQNLAIAAGAVKSEGSESEILRKAAPYSIGLIILLGLITVLASNGILGFLIA
ncbi:L-lactate permease [Trueperella pecoris]|uniref:L-lactate permease n=1 Tax=Trueperella pecoris TaxID=2733571 RepID=A0A7M1QU30_9ACTO|nr:L-lactate permease [Trueperella pecoris]QOR45366.1 L-lactate permease [Trueperella pecoris]QTG75244.1 L-lactate permease [Trueperella pecoris]